MAKTSQAPEAGGRARRSGRSSSSSRRRSRSSSRSWCSSGWRRSSSPPGAYKIDPKTGGPVPGSYHELPSCSNAQGDELCVETAFDQRLKQLFIATPNGLYGVENDRGFVSADETGVLYGSAMIFLFVLAVGAFITVTMKTEAIQTGIGRLALRFRHSGSALIAILMVRLRARRDELRHVGGDARLLRPARAAGARARLRPHGRRRDHLPRRGHRRPVLDREPVRHRRRLRRRRHQPRGRDRRADRHVGRAGRAGHRLRHPLRVAGSQPTRRARSSASRPPTPRTRRA